MAKYKSDNTIAQAPQVDNDEHEGKKDPFYLVEKNKDANLEFILEILQEMTAKRGLRKLLRYCLLKYASKCFFY